MIIKSYKRNKILLLLITVLAASSELGPMASFYSTGLYLGVLTLMILMGIGNVRRIDLKFFGFALAGFISLMLNSPDPLFQAWPRYVYFVIVLCATSPMISGRTFAQLRLDVLKYSLYLVSIVSVLSFFAYFLGINYMKSGSINSAGSFGGLTGHSMTLGPFSAMAVTCCLWLYLNTSYKKYRYWMVIAMFSSFGSLLLSSSRGAFVGALTGMAVVLYYQRIVAGKQGGITKFLFIAIIAIPLLTPFSEALLEKQQNNIQMGGTFSSRQGKWDNRIEEFMSSPIYGVGIGTIDNVNHPEDVNISGVIEPGSSWLSVLSMTGIIGGLFMVLILFEAFNYLKRGGRGPDSVLLIGIFAVFFVMHIVEGSIFAGGNYLCFFFWLLLGGIYAYFKDGERVIFAKLGNKYDKSYKRDKRFQGIRRRME